MENFRDKTIQSALIEAARNFLSSLSSGASENELSAILADMREKEEELLKREDVMLAPEIWRILHSRLAKRRESWVIPIIAASPVKTEL